jgi:hypothetical protein
LEPANIGREFYKAAECWDSLPGGSYAGLWGIEGH